jgi:UDP-glucose:(heptosyl)LPS alpha-1,3-glucosyltransferase
MRVALSFPGCHRRGGVERVMLECANYLASRGHETHVYSSDWDEKSMHEAVIRHHVPVRKRPNIAQVTSFARGSSAALDGMKPRPDIIGGFGISTPRSEVVWVQSVQKAWLEISGSQRDFKGRLKQRLNLFHPLVLSMERRYYGGRKYRKLIALSDQVKDDLMRFYGVPAKDVVVIPNGFSPSEFSVARRNEQREAMRQKLGYGNTDKVVIFAANELERKGFGPLLRAIAALNDSSVHLLAVGRLNPLAYASEIQRLGMTQRVQFTGPTSDVASYYSAADVFALPTQYEAWGLVIVEAMACGLPALTSRLAGASIAIDEGKTGQLLDDPADVQEISTKLSLLLQGKHASPEVISDSVAQYAWSRVLETYESVLTECARA